MNPNYFKCLVTMFIFWDKHLWCGWLFSLVQKRHCCNRTMKGGMKWNLGYLKAFKINVSTLEFSNFQKQMSFIKESRAFFSSLTWQGYLYFLYSWFLDREGFYFGWFCSSHTSWLFHTFAVSCKRQSMVHNLRTRTSWVSSTKSWFQVT